MSRNEEQSNGERNHMALSSILRTMGSGYRYIDVDIVQLCSRCHMPEVMIESTSANHKATYYLRRMAAACNSPALLLRHSWMDVDHAEPVDVYLWEPGRTGRKDPPDKTLEGVTWDRFLDALRFLHHRHRCKS